MQNRKTVKNFTKGRGTSEGRRWVIKPKGGKLHEERIQAQRKKENTERNGWHQKKKFGAGTLRKPSRKIRTCQPHRSFVRK